MTTPAPLASQAATFTPEGFELVKSDIRAVSQFLADANTIWLSGTDRICLPVKGRARFWCVSDTATAGSTGAAYHVLSLTRNGQSETGLTVDTRVAEIGQYTLNYLGDIVGSQGAFCKLVVAVTGAPAPTLSAANFCLYCQLSPTPESPE